jgi:hypothetical protein
MADINSLFYGLALTNSAGGWLTVGINIILSTIIGGLILLLLVEILGKEWGESVHPVNAFFVVLVINIVNIIGIIGFLSAIVPVGSLIIPFLVWVILIKVFFSDMPWKHAAIAGILGYLLSIFLVPYIIGFVSGFLPSFVL